MILPETASRWCNAGVAGELRIAGRRPVDRADLAEQLGRAQRYPRRRAAAVTVPASACVCAARDRARRSSGSCRSAEQVARDLCSRAWFVRAGGLTAETVEPDGTVKRAQWHLQRRPRVRAGASATAAWSDAAPRPDRRDDRPGSFSSRSASSPARGPSSSGSCSAALATADASIESDSPRVRPASSLRCGQRGGTAQSRSPASTSVRRTTRHIRQSSSARRRCLSSDRAQRSDLLVNGAPCSRACGPTSTATAVSECLSTSTPITINSTRLQLDGATSSGRPHSRRKPSAPIRSRSTVSGRRRRHDAGRSAQTRHPESSHPPPSRPAPRQTTPRPP